MESSRRRRPGIAAEIDSKQLMGKAVVLESGERRFELGRRRVFRTKTMSHRLIAAELITIPPRPGTTPGLWMMKTWSAFFVVIELCFGKLARHA